MQRRVAVLRACLEVRADCSEWEVELDGAPARAISYHSLAGPLAPGDRVLLNTTAVALTLGTGGTHFVIARLEEPREEPFSGREAGHILKLRYTPLQVRVMAAEERASPYSDALLDFDSLVGMPVLGAELHSQAGAAAIAAKATVPDLRIVLLWLDSAALPLALSRLVGRLKEDGILHATITTGQAFGGDLEAVNVYSGLVVARVAAEADLVIVTQGPGNVGTGSQYGFSGISLVEAFHAADTLDGVAIFAPRISQADPRGRHHGLSHHSHSIIRCTRAPLLVPVPTGWPPQRIPQECRREVDPSPVLPALETYQDVLTTMGRDLNQDPLFFRASAAAGVFAAQLARERRLNT